MRHLPLPSLDTGYRDGGVDLPGIPVGDDVDAQRLKDRSLPGEVQMRKVLLHPAEVLGHYINRVVPALLDLDLRL